MIDFNGTLVPVEMYEDFKDGETQLFGDVMAGLERLSNKHLMLVSRTPSDLLERRAQALGIGKYFSRMIGSVNIGGTSPKEFKKKIIRNAKDAPYENVYFVGNDPEEIRFFNEMRGNGSQNLYSVAIARGNSRIAEYNRKADSMGTATARPNYMFTSFMQAASALC